MVQPPKLVFTGKKIVYAQNKKKNKLVESSDSLGNDSGSENEAKGEQQRIALARTLSQADDL